MDFNSESIKLKKIGNYINSNTRILFDRLENSEVYLACDKAIAKYNFNTGFITEKIKISESKILNFLINNML